VIARHPSPLLLLLPVTHNLVTSGLLEQSTGFNPQICMRLNHTHYLSLTQLCCPLQLVLRCMCMCMCMVPVTAGQWACTDITTVVAYNAAVYVQCVPLPTEPGISLIILPLHYATTTLQTHTTDTFLFISHTTNVLLFKLRCNIFIGVRIIKEMPGSVASGTPCMW